MREFELRFNAVCVQCKRAMRVGETAYSEHVDGQWRRYCSFCATGDAPSLAYTIDPAHTLPVPDHPANSVGYMQCHQCQRIVRPPEWMWRDVSEPTRVFAMCIECHRKLVPEALQDTLFVLDTHESPPVTPDELTLHDVDPTLYALNVFRVP